MPIFENSIKEIVGEYFFLKKKSIFL